MRIRWAVSAAVMLVLLCSLPACAGLIPFMGVHEQMQAGLAYRYRELHPVSFFGYEEKVLEMAAVYGRESSDLEAYVRWYTETSLGAVSLGYGGYMGNSRRRSVETADFSTPFAVGISGHTAQRRDDIGYGVAGEIGLSTGGLTWSAVPFVEMHALGRWRVSLRLGEEVPALRLSYTRRRSPLQFELEWQDFRWIVGGVFDSEDFPANLGVGWRRDNMYAWVKWHF